MTVPPEAITEVAYCVHCGQTIPHAGTAWRDTYRCRLFEGIYAAGAAAERDRWAGKLREMACAVLPQVTIPGGLDALAKADPNSPAQIQGRLLLDIADLLDGDR